MATEELRIHPAGLERAVHLTKKLDTISVCGSAEDVRIRKLSSGKAAELAGMSRVEFFEACSRYHVSLFNYPDEELQKELEADLTTMDKILKR
jgi:predicted HTH domain antitoxin